MSTRRRGALFAAACALALSAGSAALGQTLADAIGMAYQTNPVLQAQRAQQRALDENYVQSRAGYRPDVDASSDLSYTRRSQDQFGDFDTDSVSLSVTANQPIYTGGRVAADIRASEADILSGRQQLRSVESNVLLNVIQSYVDIRRDLAALNIRQENVNVLRRQLEETQARFEVGEITRTDVAQSEARLAVAQGQFAAAQAQLAISRSNFAAVVGQSPVELAPEPQLPALPATITDAVAIAERENPVVLAADYAEQAAAARVALARAAYRPTVGLATSVGAGGPVGLDLNDYTAQVTTGLRATVPLFTGGLNASRVRQALERETAARLTVETRRREVIQDVSQAWNQLLAARAAYISNEQGVRAARVAFEGTQEEARVGLRTTLDVLNAEQELRNAELALIQSRRDAYVATAGLLSSMGRLEAQNLVAGVPAYDPTESFYNRAVAGRVPWEPLVQRIDTIGAPPPPVPRLPDPTDIPEATQPFRPDGVVWRVQGTAPSLPGDGPMSAPGPQPGAIQGLPRPVLTPTDPEGRALAPGAMAPVRSPGDPDPDRPTRR